MIGQLLYRFGLRQPRDAYREMFADSGWRVFHRALEEAKRSQQNYLSLGHIIDALSAEDPASFDAVMLRSGVESQKAKEFIRENIESYPKQSRRGVQIAPDAVTLLRKVKEVAREEGRKMEAADFFSVLLRGMVAFPRAVVWKVS